MIKRGLILCILTVLISSLFIECVYYGDRLLSEFRFTEKAETMAISEISTFDPNDTGGIYLFFRYRDPETEKEYSNPGIFTQDTSYQVGDPVEVITRNGCPKELVCTTKRGRQRTALERAADVGIDCGMIVHILITGVLLLLLGIPNRRMIPEECRSRKKFFLVSTTIYGLISAAACVLWIMAVHDNTWDGLGYAFLSLLLFFGGSAALLIAWLTDSVIRKKRLSSG